MNKTLKQIHSFCRDNNICVDSNNRMLLWGNKATQRTLVYQHIKFSIDFFTIANQPCPQENLELMNRWKKFIGAEFE